MTKSIFLGCEEESLLLRVNLELLAFLIDAKMFLYTDIQGNDIYLFIDSADENGIYILGALLWLKGVTIIEWVK